jgi:reactive chlorine resistance protein C
MVLGSVMAVGIFLATITFLFTTPGVGDATAGGFPVLSATGQFLIKDVALLGLSAWTLADSLRAVVQRSDA